MEQALESNGRTAYHFAYQPILNGAQASVGVELQLAGGDALHPDPERAAFAAAEAVIHAFIHSGLDGLLRHRRAWIAAGPALLGSGLLDLLPASRFALRVDPATAPSLARLAQLRLAGFLLALDGRALAEHPQRGELLQVADVVAFDAADLANPDRKHFAASLRGGPHQRLARQVDLPADFEALHHAGFDFFQGYYFAHRMEAAGTRIDPRRAVLLDLLAKLAQDADDPVLDEIFRGEPALSLHLLRLVNSSAFGLQVRITSLKHAFTVLGRAQLMRWLQVLLYALGDTERPPSALLELALRRARFLEYTLKYVHHQKTSHLMDEAYMTGLLSLADVLIGWPMAKVAEKLHLADAVRDALLDRAGLLGRLLQLAEALEQADFDRAGELAAALPLGEEEMMQAQNEALSYAHVLSDRHLPAGDKEPKEPPAA